MGREGGKKKRREIKPRETTERGKLYYVSDKEITGFARVLLGRGCINIVLRDVGEL